MRTRRNLLESRRAVFASADAILEAIAAGAEETHVQGGRRAWLDTA